MLGRMNVAQLKPNPKNPRTITDVKLGLLKKALNEFGDLGGFVFNRSTQQLVGGHQRAKLFDKKAAVTIDKRYPKPTKTGTVAEGFIVLKGERFRYREVQWDSIKEKAANIAANKGAGEWDFSELGNWFKEIDGLSFDLDLTMFDEDERARFLETDKEEDDKKADAVPSVPKKAKTKLGDIYQLGIHRLMCGDATHLDDVEKLMGGKKAQFAFMSPPYNLGKSVALRSLRIHKRESAYEHDDDDKVDSSYLEMLCAATVNAISVSEIQAVNIQWLTGNKVQCIEWLEHFKANFVDVLIWAKTNPSPAMAEKVVSSGFEFIFLFSNERNPNRKIPTAAFKRGTFHNVLSSPHGSNSHVKGVHGATFPVSLAEHYISNLSSGSVLDLFGGSGSTLIASEKLQRKCFMMELDPLYCDVTVTRWEEFTGRKAKLL